MKWSTEVLNAYEAQERRNAISAERGLLRARMRREQAQGRWIDLMGKFRGCVLEINREAGRTILAEDQSSGDRLVLKRGIDGARLAVSFHKEMYRVSVTAPTIERDFELTIREKNGNDAAVWTDRQSDADEPDQAIATSIIRDFLLVLI